MADALRDFQMEIKYEIYIRNLVFVPVNFPWGKEMMYDPLYAIEEILIFFFNMDFHCTSLTGICIFV